MATYRADHAATGRWLRTSAELQAACHDAAERIAARARAIAPVDSGAYRSGIVVRDEPNTAWDGRVGSVVEATAPHSATVEWGTRRHRGRGQHVLRRAVEGLQ